MIRINLLPYREERRKTLRQQFFVLAGLVTVLAGLVWFVGYGYINGQIESQAGKNAFLKSEIALLDTQIEEIKKLKEQTDIMLARKRVIESLQANRSETVHLFNELARQLPPGVYLTSIKQEAQKITLVGYAQSNARVSTLMQNLEGTPVLERPVLIEIKGAEVGKQRMNQFTLAVHITRQTNDTPPQKPGAAASKAGGRS
jgi:type IV pilus assembly protein PilN